MLRNNKLMQLEIHVQALWYLKPRWIFIIQCIKYQGLSQSSMFSKLAAPCSWGEYLRWLEADLKAARAAGKKWIIAGGHRPLVPWWLWQSTREGADELRSRSQDILFQSFSVTKNLIESSSRCYENLWALNVLRSQKHYWKRGCAKTSSNKPVAAPGPLRFDSATLEWLSCLRFLANLGVRWCVIFTRGYGETKTNHVFQSSRELLSQRTKKKPCEEV